MKTAEKVLQKWISRSLGQTMEYFFSTWKRMSNDIGYKQSYQLRVISNVHRIKLRMAFQKWCQAKENDDKAIMIEFIEQAELGNGCLQSALVMK